MPAEIRLQLLFSLSELRTLRSLVLASPAMHAQYLENRNAVLRVCLARELDGYYPDAEANQVARVQVLGVKRTDEVIANYLTCYRGGLDRSKLPPGDRDLHDGEIRWMARYHLCVAQPLARLYSEWAISNLEGAAASATSAGPASAYETRHNQGPRLSRSEEIRIFRAIYRYDVYCRLFGQNEGRRIGAYRHHEINELFFNLFDPWEAEAIGCIDIFVRHKYEETFDRVKNDLHDSNPKFRQEDGVLNPEGSYDLIAEHDDYMDGIISRGLGVMMRTAFINDHEKLLSRMDLYLTHANNLDDSVQKSLSTLAQDDRRSLSPEYPNDKDKAEERGDRVMFEGDYIPPVTSPFAWVTLWNGRYSNIYGEYVPVSLRRWGYVMWDERRWDNLGARELIFKQWEAYPETAAEIETDYDWSPIAVSNAGP